MKAKILLVDDDPAVRKMVGRILQQEGYLVVLAANGQEALDLAASTDVNLVLLDLNLPVKNGWDTFEQLTAAQPLLPIVIITARSNQLFPSLGAGVGGLMEKPLDFPKLLQTVRLLLEEPKENRFARVRGQSTDFHYAPARQSRDRI